MPKTQKIIAIFLAVSIITSGFFFPFKTKEAKADLAGDFMDKCVTDAAFDVAVSLELGKILRTIEAFLSPDKVPSSDSQQQYETRRFELKQCLLRLKDLAIATAHNILKKRLLDQLVDQTVNWLQNGGEPRFVTDFGRFFEDAKQAAIGDTLRDIGLGKLCDSRAFAKIELTLGKRTPQKFTQDVTCTLNQVVGNINAFREDFNKGGWLGVQEAANPRNNIFGLKLMAMDRVIKETDAREEAAKAEVAATGYTGQKKCLEYTLIHTRTNAAFKQGTGYPIGPNNSIIVIGSNPVPANADGAPPNIYDAAVKTSGLAYWLCSKDEIITPADTAAAIIAKTGGLDYDYILSSQDVSSYITAISDALINRLTTEAGKGLSGIFKGSGSPPRGSATSRDSLYITGGIRDATNNYNANMNEKYTYSANTINANKTNLLDTLAQATSSLINAGSILSVQNPNVSLSNTNLICTLNGGLPCTQRGLQQCITRSQTNPPYLYPYVSAAPIGPDVLSTISAAQAQATTISSAVTEVNTLLTQANILRNRIQSVNTSADLTALVTDVGSFSNSAKNLEAQANALSTEITSLLTEATKQRDECNFNYQL